MTDIYSDEILTAPPRVVHRVKAAITMTDEAALCRAMLGAITAEREAPVAVAPPKAEPPKAKPVKARPARAVRIRSPLWHRVQRAVREIGEASLGEIMAHTGMSRTGVGEQIRPMCAEGVLVNRREGAGRTALLYRLPGSPIQPDRRPVAVAGDTPAARAMFIAAMTDRGECSVQELSIATGRSYASCNRLALAMFKEGVIERRRNPKTRNGYVYHMISTEAGK